MKIKIDWCLSNTKGSLYRLCHVDQTKCHFILLKTIWNFKSFNRVVCKKKNKCSWQCILRNRCEYSKQKSYNQAYQFEFVCPATYPE